MFYPNNHINPLSSSSSSQNDQNDQIQDQDQIQNQLVECGPRFALFPFKILRGTMEDTNAQVEWVYRPYMNSSKRRRILSETLVVQDEDEQENEES